VSKENDTNVGGPCGRHDCRSSTEVLPSHIQDLYIDVDLESQVSAYRYRWQLQYLQQNKLQVFYKGGKVSFISKVDLLCPQSYHLLFFIFLFFQLKLNTRKKYNLSRSDNDVCLIGNKTMRCPGGGQPKKWSGLEEFIDQKVQFW